jgi:hypothetical protein
MANKLQLVRCSNNTAPSSKIPRMKRTNASVVNKVHPFANDVSLQFVWAIKQNQTLQKHSNAHEINGYSQLPCLLHILRYLSGGLAKVLSFGSGVAVASRLVSVFADLNTNSHPN